MEILDKVILHFLIGKKASQVNQAAQAVQSSQNQAIQLAQTISALAQSANNHAKVRFVTNIRYVHRIDLLQHFVLDFLFRLLKAPFRQCREFRVLKMLWFVHYYLQKFVDRD